MKFLLNRNTKCSQTFHTNTINSNGNATLNIQQNGNTFISLLGDALNRVQINRFFKELLMGVNLLKHNLLITVMVIIWNLD